MKQFGKVFRFEIKGYLKNKIFVGSICVPKRQYERKARDDRICGG